MIFILEVAIGIIVAYIGLHILGYVAMAAIKILTGDF